MPRRTRQDPPSTRAARRSRATEAETPAEQPLSDAQEIDFLDKREGHTWHPAQVDQGVRLFRERRKSADGEAGRRIWEQGDTALELYNGFAERAKGVRTFLEFARKELKIKKPALYEMLRARRRVKDALTAEAYGRGRMTIAFRIMDALGIVTFEALEKEELPLPDGETCHFPATVDQLRAALKLIKGQKAEEEKKKHGGKAPSKALQRKATAKNEAVKLARPEIPELDGVPIEYVARDGDVFLETGPLNTEQQVALAKLILRLEDET